MALAIWGLPATPPAYRDVQVMYVPTAKASIEGGTFQQHAAGRQADIHHLLEWCAGHVCAHSQGLDQGWDLPAACGREAGRHPPSA